MSTAILTRLGELRIVLVVEIDDPADAAPLARTLVEAGLPVVEITLRTAAGLEAVARAAAEVPDCLVGAGTLLDPAMIVAAAKAGASFGVSPGATAACLEAAAAQGLAYVPGAVSPGEVMMILAAGLTHVKFFPAGAFGGLTTLRALSGPFASAGVRFMPTGGVTETNALDFLASDSVFAVGGTWIAPRADIAARRWDLIGERARTAAGLHSGAVA
jgi:2-dehydro-3-deoxyphosphogluconate aldolase/(4S)-4-hydroxy-2-oxoglutarate aldolase